MHNISIHDMKRWWICEFFPSTYFEDLKRFWQKDLIHNELMARNFDVNETTFATHRAPLTSRRNSRLNLKVTRSQMPDTKALPLTELKSLGSEIR